MKLGTLSYTKHNIDKLEAVQRRATRWITRSDDDYDTRLSKLKLLSLSDRRFIRDVTFLFNVITVPMKRIFLQSYLK